MREHGCCRCFPLVTVASRSNSKAWAPLGTPTELTAWEGECNRIDLSLDRDVLSIPLAVEEERPDPSQREREKQRLASAGYFGARFVHCSVATALYLAGILRRLHMQDDPGWPLLVRQHSVQQLWSQDAQEPRLAGRLLPQAVASRS